LPLLFFVFSTSVLVLSFSCGGLNRFIRSGFHGLKLEQTVLIPDVPETVELGYNNNFITTKVSARYNIELL
jgi:hypothetical protein